MNLLYHFLPESHHYHYHHHHQTWFFVYKDRYKWKTGFVHFQSFLPYFWDILTNLRGYQNADPFIQILKCLLKMTNIPFSFEKGQYIFKEYLAKYCHVSWRSSHESLGLLNKWKAAKVKVVMNYTRANHFCNIKYHMEKENSSWGKFGKGSLSTCSSLSEKQCYTISTCVFLPFNVCKSTSQGITYGHQSLVLGRQHSETGWYLFSFFILIFILLYMMCR